MASAIIPVRTFRRDYRKILDFVATASISRSPRGVPTRDAGFVVLEIQSPLDVLATGIGRKLSPAVAAAEAIQLIGAFSDPELTVKASPQFQRYRENEGHFHGAYGTRIGRQVHQAVAKLREDPETRQAVITLWDPTEDNKPNRRDYPCTVMIQFEVLRKRLCMNVVMRSNDAWRGLPYDVFQFNQLQWTVAHALELMPGLYRHTALSLHLYEDDVVAVEGVQAAPATEPTGREPVGFMDPHGVNNVWNACKRAHFVAVRQATNLTLTEQWYDDVLPR
jgi:thymidylate synthase